MRKIAQRAVNDFCSSGWDKSQTMARISCLNAVCTGPDKGGAARLKSAQLFNLFSEFESRFSARTRKDGRWLP